MHWLSRTTRLAALLVPIIAVGVVVAVFFDGAFSSSDRALATTPTLTGVYCLDFYVDVDPEDFPKGFPHDPGSPTHLGDVFTAKSLLRIEESQKQDGGWDITSMNYTTTSIPLTCPEESALAAAGSEIDNSLGADTKFSAVSEKRPTATAKVTTKELNSVPANVVQTVFQPTSPQEWTLTAKEKDPFAYDRVVVEVAHDGETPKITAASFT